MRTTRRVVILLAALGGCLAAVAYAAPHHSAPPAPGAGRVREGALPKPSLADHPNRLAISAGARFGFTARGRRLRFECRLDKRPWRPCRSPVVFTGLSAGAHRFAVRAAGAGGSHGRSARFRWKVLEPKDFSIAPQLAGLGKLYPGAPAQPLPLTISNPNPVRIFVTGLAVSPAAGAPSCSSADNLVLTDAGVSNAAPLRVPAHGSVSLPTSGVPAPAIRLRDLPVNQDACQGATFPLSFTGRARG
jgi:hypothetical protein